MDKYETDELHIPNMFQGTIKVCYLTVITILSLIVILLWIFLRDPFSKPRKICKKWLSLMGIKRSWYLKAWLLLAIPQKFHAWNRSGFVFTDKSVK
jgi:hypothetical protein